MYVTGVDLIGLSLTFFTLLLAVSCLGDGVRAQVEKFWTQRTDDEYGDRAAGRMKREKTKDVVREDLKLEERNPPWKPVSREKLKKDQWL